MVQIDIPTAIAAVLISITLSFFRDNATALVQDKLQNRRETWKRKKDWLEEAVASAEKVEQLAITAHGEKRGIEETEEKQVEAIRDISSSDVSSYQDFLEEVESRTGFVAESIEGPNVNTPFQTSELPELKQSVVNAIREQIRETHRKELEERVANEMYEQYLKFVDHYVDREVEFSDELFDSYTAFQNFCFGLTITQEVTEEDLDELREKLDELKSVCADERDKLDQNRSYRQRITEAFSI